MNRLSGVMDVNRNENVGNFTDENNTCVCDPKSVAW